MAEVVHFCIRVRWDDVIMVDVETEYAVRCPRCRAQAVASMVRAGTKGTYREVFVKFGASRRYRCFGCRAIKTS